MEQLEYFRRDNSGRCISIGTSDVDPRMLKRLRNHETQDRLDVVEVRERATGKVLYTIPAHDAAWDECCGYCKPAPNAERARMCRRA